MAASLAFIREPNAAAWYRAHNITIVSAYLANEHLAWKEGRVERFFMNVVLIRVLFAHAMVAQPKLALGWLAPLGKVLGDPRLGMTAIFLSLSRILPDRYPLEVDLERYIDAEHTFGHLVDIGLIMPRLSHLYAWSARELDLPGLSSLLDLSGPTPAYAWPRGDSNVWSPQPSGWARAAIRLLPPPGHTPWGVKQPPTV